jgi:ribose transport system ATP-binding protein
MAINTVEESQVPVRDAQPLLSMRHITKRFPGVVALNDVSFDVYSGQIHCLVGENGAGKSTLMKIMSGVITSYEGEILLDNKPAHFGNPRDAQNAGIGMIHQELNLVPQLSVFENVFLGREYKNRFGIVDRQRMRRHTKTLLQKFGLDVDPNRTINSLRVGRQQLVEIAKALNLNTRILIMDEPTSALSEAEVEYLFGVIRSLSKQQVAIIYISHRLDEISTIADQITVLRDGSVVRSSPANEMTRDRMISLMVGRDLDSMYPKQDVPLGKEVLRVENLSLNVGGQAVLSDISLTVRQGEVVGVAGLMGAGRTELLETIFGVYPQHTVHGKLWIDGKQGFPRSPGQAIRMGIGLIAEDRKRQSLILEQSVVKNATLAALPHFLRFLLWINQQAERKAVEKLGDDLSIKMPGIHSLTATLSGGNQQKVVIGKFLLTQIKCLLMDEPTRGVDVGAKAEIYKLVGDLAQEGKGFLIVSSELPEVLAMCDRIYVLCNGRLTGEFSRNEFDQEKIMEAATRF